MTWTVPLAAELLVMRSNGQTAATIAAALRISRAEVRTALDYLSAHPVSDAVRFLNAREARS